MKICVLQPDYSTTSIDYKNWDPPRNLQRLLPGARVDHVFINKLTTYKQLKALAGRGYDCFVNLCEGYLHWAVPSIDVFTRSNCSAYRSPALPQRSTIRQKK